MALGFEKFVHAMPAEVLKTMDQGDVPLDMLNQGIKPTAERLRRSYLMDLYRFSAFIPIVANIATHFM